MWIPFLCPYGHELKPGRIVVSWTPCQCPEALQHYRGHFSVQCWPCLEAREWAAISYWPPHVGGRGHPRRFDDARALAIDAAVSHAEAMRIIEDQHGDALYVSFRDGRPAVTEVHDGGGVVADIGEDGRLLDLMVLAPGRDWSRQLEEVLGRHEVAVADAARLRSAAAPR